MKTRLLHIILLLAASLTCLSISIKAYEVIYDEDGNEILLMDTFTVGGGGGGGSDYDPPELPDIPEWPDWNPWDGIDYDWSNYPDIPYNPPPSVGNTVDKKDCTVAAIENVMDKIADKVELINGVRPTRQEVL
jgi:hypothetical protein